MGAIGRVCVCVCVCLCAPVIGRGGEDSVVARTTGKRLFIRCVCVREREREREGGRERERQGDWNTARIPTQYRVPAFLVTSLFGPMAANYTRC